MRAQRSLKRAVAKKPKRAKYILVMEGGNTEPQYFDELVRRNSKITVDIIPIKNAGAPKTLTEKAIECRNIQTRRSYEKEHGTDDKVWAIFDRDEHDYIEESFAACRKNDVSIAYSNPCFEVWLILHYQDYDKDEHRQKTQEACEGICPGYEKNKRKIPNLALLIDRIEEAEKRAEVLLARREKDDSPAPFTTVHELTKTMRGL